MPFRLKWIEEPDLDGSHPFSLDGCRGGEIMFWFSSGSTFTGEQLPKPAVVKARVQRMVGRGQASLLSRCWKSAGMGPSAVWRSGARLAIISVLLFTCASGQGKHGILMGISIRNIVEGIFE